MNVKILCITDPTTHPEFDTTVELYNVIAGDQRFSLFHAPLSSANSDGSFFCHQLSQPVSYAEFLALDSLCTTAAQFTDFDLVFDRADHPLPDNFHEHLALHEQLTTFVNQPSGLIHCKQKEFGLSVARDFFEDSIFTRDLYEAEEFLRRFPEAVAKMNTSYGGRGVFRITLKSEVAELDNIVSGKQTFDNPSALLTWLFNHDSEPYQISRFLKNVVEGDKRILVVDGDIYGGYLRKSPSGSWIQNVTSGGQAFPAEVTPYEEEVIRATAPAFQRCGVRTLGYHFLLNDDGKSWCLSEINGGNIGGYGRLQSTSGAAIYDKLKNWLYQLARVR